MKIAFNIFFYSDKTGGVEKYASNLATGLIKKGHTIDIYCYKHSTITPVDNLRLIKVPAIKINSAIRVLSFAKNSFNILKEKRNEYDIIQGFGRTYYQDVYRVGSGTHYNYLKNTHESMKNPLGKFANLLNPRNKAIMHLENKTYSKGNYKKIVCNSILCKTEVMDIYKVPEKDITIIYNGVDHNVYNKNNRNIYAGYLRNEYNIKEDEMIILFAGSGYERKGLDIALQAVARFNKSFLKYKFVILGKGNIAPYRRMLPNLGLNEKVLFLGHQYEIFKFYAAADVFLFPTKYDPFANVCLEAAASGLPVITSKTNGFSEVIQNSINGFVAPQTDDIEFYVNALNSLTDENLRQTISNNAYKMSLNYTNEKNLDAVEKLYNNIANGSNNVL